MSPVSLAHAALRFLRPRRPRRPDVTPKAAIEVYFDHTRTTLPYLRAERAALDLPPEEN
jgi:hypothetical protein